MATAHPPLELIPDKPATLNGPVSRAFRERGATTLRAAAELVWRLPYGRNNAPDDPLCILSEGRGTCSTKHALLARLLREQHVEGFELRLGMYEMSEANTPGIGETLARHGLASIPEAHCYLVTGGRRIDLTRVLPHGVEPIGRFMVEEAIEPDQIGEYKRRFHRAFLERYARSHPEIGLGPDDLWRIREECIAQLASAS